MVEIFKVKFRSYQQSAHFIALGLFFGLGLTLQGVAQAAERFKFSDLNPGQCASDPEAKLYLSGLKVSRQASYDRIRAEIGENRINELQDNSSSSYYFCQVTCKDRQGSLAKIWVGLTDMNSRFSDMNGFLCPSVRVEQVQIVGSIYGPQPVVTPFMSYESGFPELQAWLGKSHFLLSAGERDLKKAELNKTLTMMSAAYAVSSSSVLRQAAIEIWEIASGSEVGMVMLKAALAELKASQWNVPQDFTSPHYFVLNALRINARFLEYVAE